MFDKNNPKRILVIACEVVARELYALASRSPRVVDVALLPKGLHNLESPKMRARIQEEIDKADAKRYDAVALGYGLCNNGTLGLVAPAVPLVIPRVHDCISLFLGSAESYRQYFDANPGTYYETTGWTERGASDLAENMMSQLGMTSTYAEYVEKYGKENADYIIGVLGNWRANYRRMTYIRMPVEGLPDYSDLARREARENNWEFDLVQGGISLLEAMVLGEWDDERFCVVAAGSALLRGADDAIFAASPKDRDK